MLTDSLVNRYFPMTGRSPSNGTLFVVGDTTMDEILPVLEKAFGKWRENRSAIPQKNLAIVDLANEGRVIIVDKPGSPQSLILAGHIAPPTGTADNIAINTMNDIIGGQFTARVNMNLREDKGWAYGAFTFMPDSRGQRMWMVYAPVQTDRTRDSIEEMLREFNEYLSDAPATDDELVKSVRNNVNSLPGQFETGGAVLGSMLSNQRFGRDDSYVESLTDRYEGLDLEDVHEAAENVMHVDRLTWLIVGDREKIESDLRGMELGPNWIFGLWRARRSRQAWASRRLMRSRRPSATRFSRPAAFALAIYRSDWHNRQIKGTATLILMVET